MEKQKVEKWLLPFKNVPATFTLCSLSDGYDGLSIILEDALACCDKVNSKSQKILI